MNVINRDPDGSDCLIVEVSALSAGWVGLIVSTSDSHGWARFTPAEARLTADALYRAAEDQGRHR